MGWDGIGWDEGGLIITLSSERRAICDWCVDL